MDQTLVGRIERVTYHHPDTGFVVLSVLPQGQRAIVTLVGKTPHAAAGEAIVARGKWTVDPERGRQFKAEHIELTAPANPESLEMYLASGAVKGIGPTLAHKIIAFFGDRSVEVFDKTPSLLADVPGIGRKRVEWIRQSWHEQRGAREIAIFLHPFGIGPSRARKLFRQYGADAIRLIKANPYRLVADVRGIGFQTADSIARQLGLAADAPDRIRAAARHVVDEAAGEGHTALSEVELIQRTKDLVDQDDARALDAIEAEIHAGVFAAYGEGRTRLISRGDLFAYEKEIAERVRQRLAVGSAPLAQINVTRAIAWAEEKLQLVLARGQREAIEMACRSSLCVVTGGPGVGKTTLVRVLCAIFGAKKSVILLGAPTGRAAKRLADASGRMAKTLHRLLEIDPTNGQFMRGPERPLEGELILVDELSMLDVRLAASLLAATPLSASMVLVGDTDQLPSVGPGRVLGDLVESGIVPVARLTEVFRQARDSQIVAAARAVNAGEVPAEPTGDALSDFYIVKAPTPDDVTSMILQLVSERIPRRFKLDPRSDIRVLTPMNRGPLGAEHLNRELQRVLNPPNGKEEIARGGTLFRVGDRVMQRENDYGKDVFNGDLGTLVGLKPIEQQAIVDFEGRSVEYDFTELDQLSLAYATTIHKSQGSEYPCVLVPVHSQHFIMLRRNLLYTAITRGKRLVILVGTRRALSFAVQRTDDRRRQTLLLRRLTTDRKP